MAKRHFYAAEWGRRMIYPYHPVARQVCRFDTKKERDAWVADDPAWRKPARTNDKAVRSALDLLRLGFTFPINLY